MYLSREGIQHADIDLQDEDDAPLRPSSASELLRYWHTTLGGLDDDYTLGDLFALLVEVVDVDLLSPLLGCDVSAFLEDAATPCLKDDDLALAFLQVRAVAELTTYEPDPEHPDDPLRWLDETEADEQDSIDAGVASLIGEPTPRKVVDATGDDPITGGPMLQRIHVGKRYGRWTGPYVLTRQFLGWGRWSEPYDGYFVAHPDVDPERFEGAYGLSMTPLFSLMHLPLRNNAAVQFWSDYPSGKGTVQFETTITTTFGEFLYAIFEEIGFHGSPVDRDEARDMLRERMDAIDRDRSGHGRTEGP